METTIWGLGFRAPGPELRGVREEVLFDRPSMPCESRRGLLKDYVLSHLQVARYKPTSFHTNP